MDGAISKNEEIYSYIECHIKNIGIAPSILDIMNKFNVNVDDLKIK